MPIRPPSDAKIITDNRITIIRVVSTLYDLIVKRDSGASAKVKATMLDKDAPFVESTICIGALRPGNTKGPIDTQRAYDELVKTKKITLEQFLGCCTVGKEALKEHVGEKQVTSLSTTIVDPSFTLTTEFKPGVELDFDELATSLAGAIAKAVR